MDEERKKSAGESSAGRRLIDRRQILGGLALAGAAGATGPAAAQTAWPSRTVRLVVAYPAGGNTDVIARMFADKLQQMWGQPVVVENRGGAAGVIGADSVARSAPDGYTLLFAASPEIAIARSTQRNLPYDPVKSFAGVSLITQTEFVLYATASLPANNLKELVALAKEKPGQLTYGSFGNGTSNHFMGELFKMLAGIDITHIPYRGGGPMMIDLISGTVQLAFEAVNTGMPHVRSGKLKTLGAAMTRRSPLTPDVPTFEEQGLKGFAGGSWVGVVAPKGTPEAVVDKVAADIKSLMDGGIAKEIEKLGLLPDYRGPADFGAFIEDEVTRWGDVAKRANIGAN